jgi:hypothetical protein
VPNSSREEQPEELLLHYFWLLTSWTAEEKDAEALFETCGCDAAADPGSPSRWHGRVRRLRLHGFIERIAGTHRNRVTDHGLRAALLFSRTGARILRPAACGLAACAAAHRSGSNSSMRLCGQPAASLSSTSIRYA